MTGSMKSQKQSEEVEEDDGVCEGDEDDDEVVSSVGSREMSY